MSNCFCQCRYVNIRLLSPLRRKNHGVFRGDNCVTYDDLNKDNSRMFDILNYESALKIYKSNTRCKCCEYHKKNRPGIETLNTTFPESH